MSMINSYCDEIHWGQILDGIYLIQIGAMNKSTIERGIEDSFLPGNKVQPLPGRFGLTISNDPFILFSEHPSNIPLGGELVQVRWQQIFDNEIHGEYHSIHRLVQRCLESGWSQREHGFLGRWLQEMLMEFIDSAKNPLEVYKGIGITDEAREQFFEKFFKYEID